MSATVAAKKRTGVGAILEMEEFERLAGELRPWRKSDDLEVIEKAKGSALVFPFVKGLRLSARLIYILRAHLSETNLEVDWGQLLNDQGDSCSPECDIIIHHKGFHREWNDHKNPVMHFRFIKGEKAVAVVSCKSYADRVDTGYAKKLHHYVKNVLLFAECCAPGRVNSLRKKAKAAGYTGFWHLYTYDDKSGSCINDPDTWTDFLRTVISITRRAKER